MKGSIAMENIFEINEALSLLKEGIILKDKVSTRFICKKKRIYIYSSNSSYNLSFEDFYELFKDNKFVVEDFDDSSIDIEKDKEYYSFKHK